MNKKIFIPIYQKPLDLEMIDFIKSIYSDITSEIADFDIWFTIDKSEHTLFFRPAKQYLNLPTKQFKRGVWTELGVIVSVLKSQISLAEKKYKIKNTNTQRHDELKSIVTKFFKNKTNCSIRVDEYEYQIKITYKHFNSYIDYDYKTKKFNVFSVIKDYVNIFNRDVDDVIQIIDNIKNLRDDKIAEISNLLIELPKYE